MDLHSFSICPAYTALTRYNVWQWSSFCIYYSLSCSCCTHPVEAVGGLWRLFYRRIYGFPYLHWMTYGLTSTQLISRECFALIDLHLKGFGSLGIVFQRVSFISTPYSWDTVIGYTECRGCTLLKYTSVLRAIRERIQSFLAHDFVSEL